MQPCLVSDADTPPIPGLGKGATRKTKYTVEAISLQPVASFGGSWSAVAGESWIGINQGRSNRFIEHFLRAGYLSDLLPAGKLELEREKTVGKSKLDFIARGPSGNSFLEVKTPLIHLPTDGHPNADPNEKQLTSYQRLVKHFGDLAASLPDPNASAPRGTKRKRGSATPLESPKKDRSILLLTFHYDAPQFKRPPATSSIKAITDAAAAASKRGVEFFQCNLRLDRDGVDLIRCWKLPDDY